MKNKISIVILMLFCSLGLQAGELRFDKHGQMMLPDQTYLEQGAIDQQEGYLNDAMRNFKKAAKFGNPYAQSAIGFMHMKNKEFVSALAWFRLVDLKMIDKDEVLIKLMAELEAKVSAKGRLQADQLHAQLISEYGKEASMSHREQWQKSLSFGGSKIKGRVPNRLKIYPTGRFEMRHDGTPELFVSSTYVSGAVVQRKMDEFVYEYELKFTRGDVHLQDVEIIENDQQI